MKEEFEKFKNHLKNQLESINNNYTYNINWFTDIQKNTRETDIVNVSDKELFIVLTPNPSTSYGDSAIVQQLEIQLMCEQKFIADAIDILTDYQTSVVNRKWFSGDTMVNESWYSPMISENFVNFKVNKGAIISMSGSVTFTENVVDIERVLINNQENKMFQFMVSNTADTLPFTNFSGVTKNVNRKAYKKIDLKCKFTSSLFCMNCRKWLDGINSENLGIPVKITYTDGYEKTYTMIISAVVFSYTDGMIPTISATLVEKA